MKVHSESPVSRKEAGEESLLFRGTRAFQSVFGQVGDLPGKRTVGGKCSVSQNVGLTRIASPSGITGGNAPVVDVSKGHEKSGKSVQRESLWRGASLLKAALGNSAAAKANRDGAVKGSPAGAAPKAGPAPRFNEKVVWRSADPRIVGSANTCLKKLTKRELALKRLELRPLLNALRFVESSNRVNVPDGDDGSSIGPLQISLDYHHDVWEKRHPWERVRQIDHAEETVIQYWSIYCPKALETQDYETLAKVHNGGPKGPAAAKTTYYWSKVFRHLKEQQEIKIPMDAQHLPPQKGQGAKTAWKDAPKKPERPGARKPPLPPVALPPTPKPAAKAHRHAHHAKLVHIRKHQVPQHRPAKPVVGSKRQAKEPPPARLASPPPKPLISHSRRSSFSSTASCGHFSQASSSAAPFPPQEGGFSFTPPDTPRRKLQPPAHLVIPQVSPETPKTAEDLTIQPGDSISQQQSPAHSEISPSPKTPSGDSHFFRLRQLRTHCRDELAGLSEQEASKAEAILAEMAQQVDRKRGALKLGFRVSPRARLSPPKRKKHLLRSSMDSVGVGTRQQDEGGRLEVEQSLEQKVAGALFTSFQHQSPRPSDLDSEIGLSDHEAASPISSTGSLSPEKAFSMAFLQTAIRLSQKKVAAVIIQRAYRKHSPRRSFLKLRATAIRLQELVRAWQVGKPQRLAFVTLRQATLNLQTLRRANQERRSTMLRAVQERIRFLSTRRTAVEIQRVWRGHLVRKGCSGVWEREATWALEGKTSDERHGASEASVAAVLSVEGKLEDVTQGGEPERGLEGEPKRANLLAGGDEKRGFECCVDTGLGNRALEDELVVAQCGLQSGSDTEVESDEMATASVLGGDSVEGLTVPAGTVVAPGTSAIADGEGCAVGVTTVSGHVDPEVKSAGSTPPLSPGREEELYRQLAELHFHYGAYIGSGVLSVKPAFQISRVCVEAVGDGADKPFATEEAASMSSTFSEAESPTFQTDCLEEQSAASDSDWEEVVPNEEGAKPVAPLVSPPLTPWREEALFAQLAELLPSFGDLPFGVSTSGAESETPESASGLRRCLFPTGEAALESGEETGLEMERGSLGPEQRRQKLELDDDGGEAVRKEEWESDVTWEEAGVRSVVCSPLAGSEGRLTPRRETELLLQLAELIAQHAPAVIERVPAVKSCVQRPDLLLDGPAGDVVGKEGENDRKEVASGPSSTNGQELERGESGGRTDMGALLTMHEAALRVLKEEKVASWNDRKPLDMVALGMGAGNSCLWDEAVDDLLRSDDTGVGCTKKLREPQAEVASYLGEATQEANGSAVLPESDVNKGSSNVSMGASAVRAREAADAEEAPAVNFPGVCSPYGYAGSDVSAAVISLHKEAAPAFGGAVEFKGAALVGVEETRDQLSINDGALGNLEEFDVQVSFESRDFPSSGGCTPEHYPPTESDASIFALQRSDFLRTPVTSPAMLRAGTALLDSASKVASWNDAAANGSLSEENLRVSVAAPGETNWGLAHYDSSRASPDWNYSTSTFPEDSWTNSPSHRSFRGNTDRDSSHGGNKDSDCLSPHMSLGLVRMEVEKLNGLQKGQLTLERVASVDSRPGVNARKLAVSSTEWAHVRSELGALKQWIVEQKSPEGKQTAADLRKGLTSPQRGLTPSLELRRALTPRGMNPLSKSRSEPLLTGLSVLPGVSPSVSPKLGFPDPAQKPVSCANATLSPTPLVLPDLETCSSPEASQSAGFAMEGPVTSCQSPLGSPLTVEFTLNPVLCDSPAASRVKPKSPPRGATFDSFAAPPLERAHSAPERVIYKHASHRKDGRDCLVCRLWGEDNSTTCQGGRASLLCTRSVNLSPSSQELPPVSRSPSDLSLPAFSSLATFSSPEACTSSSIDPRSPASLPARLGSFSGYLTRSQSLNRSFSTTLSPGSSSPDSSGTFRGSYDSPDREQSSGSSDSDLSPRKASSWFAKPYYKPAVRYPVDSHLSRSQSLDHQLPRSVPKSAICKSPNPKPPRPASVSPNHRHVNADVASRKSLRNSIAKPLFGFWRRTPSPKRTLPPVRLSAGRNEPLFEPLKQTKATFERGLSAGAARLQGETVSAFEADATAPMDPTNGNGLDSNGRNPSPIVYHRESQDAQTLEANPTASFSEQAPKDRGQREGYGTSPGCENGARPWESQSDDSNRGPRTFASPGPSSDVSNCAGMFTPPRARVPSDRHFDVSNSNDDVTTPVEGFLTDQGRDFVTPISVERPQGSEFTGRKGVRSLEPDFEAVTPPSSGLRWRGFGSPRSAKKSPKGSATVMPSLVRLCQLWEKRHVDLRVRARKYRAIQLELMSLGDEVRTLYHASPAQGPSSVMRELEEAENLQRSPSEEEAAARLVLKQRDCIHAGLSYQLTQTERLQLYAAWGVRRWSTGRLKRIVYKLVWADPERCEQSASLVMQFL